ncbi:hypothetical protein GCM10027596_31450 [Nocardioides korecus]
MRHVPHPVLVPLFALALIPTAAAAQSAMATSDHGHGTSSVVTTAAGPPTPGSAPPASATSNPENQGTLTPDKVTTAPPVRVRVPALGISSSLERLRTSGDGELAAPHAWQRAGWFAEGTRPGDVGPAVIAGHVDSPDGPAVFSRLSQITPGTLIEVDRADGSTTRFRVDRTQVVAKNNFPTSAVYGPTPDSQLRLITCDGPYVRASGGYQDNLIAFATQVAA